MTTKPKKPRCQKTVIVRGVRRQCEHRVTSAGQKLCTYHLWRQ